MGVPAGVSKQGTCGQKYSVRVKTDIDKVAEEVDIRKWMISDLRAF